MAAVHGKLQAAAEKAVHSAINDHLMDAVRQALGKIDDVCRASVQQIEEHSEQRLETMMRTAREEVLSRMEARLVEDRTRWEEHQEEFRGRSAQLAQRLEQLAAETQRNLTESQRLLEHAGGEMEPRIREKLATSLARVTEDFEAAATRVSDRQLVRLMEDKLMVTREAAAQLDACSAEARAQLQSSANATMEEFKRQSEVQVDLIISESTQRVMSSLAALDAENRAACEARRRTIESDVARATEQSTEQFRTGMKAFLYSCLVAAVGAVDEHAKTTPGRVERCRQVYAGNWQRDQWFGRGRGGIRGRSRCRVPKHRRFPQVTNCASLRDADLRVSKASVVRPPARCFLRWFPPHDSQFSEPALALLPPIDT